ncbi:MAG: Flp family type IVb pilin [Gaiellales bacterium]
MLKIFTSLQLRLMDLRDREEGQTFAEYGLIIALVAILLIGSLTYFKDHIAATLKEIADSL